MKKYSKRINIWIDKDFEENIETIKNFMKNTSQKNSGVISTSDAIRYVVKECTWVVLSSEGLES